MRKTLCKTTLALATIFAPFLVGAQCMKDIDCRGDRICEQGTCIYPTTPKARGAEAAQSPTASLRDNWITDSQGCKVLNPFPKPKESIIWSGPCKEGYADGEGTVQWFLDGKLRNSYRGAFQSGKQVGRGTIIYPSGNRLEGEFREGRLVGDGELTRANGEKFVVVDKDGKLTRVTGQPTTALVMPSSVPVAPGLAGENAKWDLDMRFGGEIFPSYAIANATRKAQGTIPPRFLGDFYSQMMLRVENDKPGTRIRLTIDLDTIAGRTVTDETLDQPGTYYIRPRLQYRYSVLQNMTQPTPANLVWTVNIDGTDVYKGTKTVRIRSVNDVPFSRKKKDGNYENMNWMFAAFVNENHPWIDPLLREAMLTGKVKNFTGYQVSPQEVLKQVEAIWIALQRRRISYSNITTASGTSDTVLSQHVRFLGDTIRNQQANCIDGTVLMASILRKIGIDPIIVVVPNHAYLGFYVDQSKKTAAYVETTMISNATFQQARAQGTENQTKYAPLFNRRDPQFASIAVSRARNFGIMPISH